MYPKWLAFILTLLSCLFLMASAMPMDGGNATPAKRFKQFQARRPGPEGRNVARAAVVEHAKRQSYPSNLPKNN